MDLKDVATVAGAVATIVSASITGILAVFLKKRADMQTEKLRAELSDRSTLTTARVDYEYEARKRLYKEVEPMLFLAHRAVSSLSGRLTGMVDRIRDGRIGTDRKSTWMHDAYYQRSTAYRLLLPMVYSKILSQKLSELDFTLDPVIGRKCTALALFQDIFVDQFDLAGVKGSEIPYDPYADGRDEERDESVGRFRSFQGLVRGEVECLLSVMVPAADQARQCPIEWYVFEKELENNQTAMSKAYVPLRDLLIDFHPSTHPVVWRALLAFLFLSEFYVGARLIDTSEYDQVISKYSWQQFDFRLPGQSWIDDDAMVRSHFDAARDYVRNRIISEFKVFASAVTQSEA